MKTAVLALIATAICLLDQVQAAPIASVAQGTNHLARRGGGVLGVLGGGDSAVGAVTPIGIDDGLGAVIADVVAGVGLKRRDGLGDLLGSDGDNGLLSILLGDDGILSILSGDGLLSGLLGGDDDGLLGLGELLDGILDLDDDGLLGLVKGLLDAVDELLESLGLPLLNRDEVTKREVKSKKVNFARAHAAMKKVNKEMVATYNYGKTHYPAGHQLQGALGGVNIVNKLIEAVLKLLGLGKKPVDPASVVGDTASPGPDMAPGAETAPPAAPDAGMTVADGAGGVADGAGGVADGAGGVDSQGAVDGGAGGVDSQGAVDGGAGGVDSQGAVDDGAGGVDSQGAVDDGAGGADQGADPQGGADQGGADPQGGADQGGADGGDSSKPLL